MANPLSGGHTRVFLPSSQWRAYSPLRRRKTQDCLTDHSLISNPFVKGVCGGNYLQSNNAFENLPYIPYLTNQVFIKT